MRYSKLRLAPIIGLSLMGLIVLPGTAAAATSPTNIDGTIGAGCVSNGDASAGATFKLVWRDGNGTLVARRNVTVDSNGEWSVCVSGHQLTAGDTLKATNDGGTNTLNVPLLTMAVNRAHDYLSGRGPAGDAIRLHCDFGNGFEPCTWHDGARVGPNGYWSLRVPFDVSGGEPYFGVWNSDDGDRVTVYAQAPFVTPELGTANVSGALDPGATRTIYLYDSSMMRKGKAVVTGSLNGTDSDGSFSATFRDTGGNPVTVVAGDTIDATRLSSDSQFVVPNIVARAKASNNIVKGTCENTPSSEGYANVTLYRNGQLRGFAGFEGQDGTFRFNFRTVRFGDPADVRPDDQVVIDCIQTGQDGTLLTIVAS